MADSFFDRVYGNKNNTHTPDVLSCLANLSNDEVFTSPEVVNAMLDMLPQELFSDPNTKFLEPACKTGVFLREIAKRLLVGLEPIYPNLQERINHIFHNQLYGIAITELTSLLSRRSLYCSKYPNGRYSISRFDNAEGNIRFRKTRHTWKDGKCIYCGASKEEWDRDTKLETHAYEFIHTVKPEEIYNMKFDVILSNPPYQLNDSGAGASASPLYHKFVEQAKKLNPRFLTMIIPARWYAGGKGLDDFRQTMLNDKHLVELNDFVDASECFTGVEIKGGVCYFLWSRESKGDCLVNSYKAGKIVSSMKRPLLEKDCDTFIRYNEAIQILRKVQSYNEESFSSIVSARKPFGFATNFRDYQKEQSITHNLYIYAQKDRGFVMHNQVEKNREWIKKWKVYIPEAIGSGNMEQDIVKPILGEPNTVCTETYVIAGPFNSQSEAENAISYIKTKFFHFMLGLKKITQHTTSKTYSFVPMQSFDKSWSDDELYKKYSLTKEEIDFIEKMVREME